MITYIAILAGKLIYFLTRILKIGGGSAAPGLIALKIKPSLVSDLINQVSQNVVITGTNGKTTTARMLAQIARGEDIKIIRNTSGSNLERGIASALIKNTNWFGQVRADLGLWELDEAAFNEVAPKLKPQLVIFLNVFRDQLDRYGEVDSIVNKWSKTLEKLPKKTVVLLNSDDRNLLNLEKYAPGRVFKFNLKNYQITGEQVANNTKLVKTDFTADNIKLHGLRGSEFTLKVGNKQAKINLPIPGAYHLYDATAALVGAYLVGFPLNEAATELASFFPAFGRIEKVALPKNREAIIMLIKNPTGATQVLETVADVIKPTDNLLLALNDNLADGTDVSWIWDVDFELLTKNYQPSTINCSGTRAGDLALRLKYAGISVRSLDIEPDLHKAFDKTCSKLSGRLFILPTYTALLELQKIMTKKGLKEHYWHEN